MIELVVLACLIASPRECKDVNLGPAPSLNQCVLGGMAIAAEWQSHRPKWRVAKITCRIVKGRDA